MKYCAMLIKANSALSNGRELKEKACEKAEETGVYIKSIIETL